MCDSFVFSPQIEARRLTDELDEEAAAVDQRFLSPDPHVHLDEHLGAVQPADEQPLAASRRQRAQRAAAGVLVPEGDREQSGIREFFFFFFLFP